MPTVLYGIPNCDTVKKARAWLDAHGVAYAFHDFKKAGVPEQHLDRWLGELGWERVLNRKGNAWRGLDETVRDGVVDAGTARVVTLAAPSTIKRPIVEWESGALTVGFDPAQWPSR